MVGYDTLYQQWLSAKRAKHFDEADRIRDEFERAHRLTIFAEGDMPVEGVTVHRMKDSDYERKYGNPNVAAAIAKTESQVKQYLSLRTK